jgi:tetratricopeptide (TPR) repeat protein
MRFSKLTLWAIIGGLFTLGLLLAISIPSLRDRLSWRAEIAMTYLRGWAHPIEPLPTSLPQPRVQVTHQPTATLPPTVTPLVPESTPTPTLPPPPTATPPPATVVLNPPTWEKQDMNNCGPASLTMNLRYWGWGGDQTDIAGKLKPDRKDRNVNVEELVYFVRNNVGWLNIEYRVGGDLPLLKRFIAAGLPVMIEEGIYLEDKFWPNDDHWAAHYLMLTAYDDASQTFVGQDSFFGANRSVAYAELDHNWQAFNRVVIIIFPPDQESTVRSILGEEWDVDINRKAALEESRTDIDQDSANAFAWFNLGTNLLYFDRYGEAVEAYNRAISIGLPQRMLRYQFGPFIAYFRLNRTDDLLALVERALQRTPNSEEALLWRGWAHYRQGNNAAAVQDFYQALNNNPTYQDAQYALDYVHSNP